MDLKSFELAVQSRRTAAIVLQRADYEQLVRALPEQPGDWNKERMQYRGAQIVPTEFSHSYIVEDSPEGPLIHFVS